MRPHYLFTIIVILFVSCTGDDESAIPFIDPEFQVYVDQFIVEAETRGIDFPQAELLTVEFSNELPDDICGMGSPTWPDRPRVQISSVSGCWQDQTPLERENFMFHELGHALLDRAHTAKVFDNEYPASLMCSADVELFQCQPFNVYYADEMREYYIDELFNESTEVPSWISEGVSFDRLIFDGEVLESRDGWETLSLRVDDNDFFSHSVIENIDQSYALAIEQTEVLPEGGRYGQPAAIWFRSIEVSDITECSRLRAKARVKTPQPFDGLLEIGLSLRERDAEGALDRFALQFTTERHIERLDDDFSLMEVEVPCVPAKTVVVTLSLIFSNPTPASVAFDDIEVTLWHQEDIQVN